MNTLKLHRGGKPMTPWMHRIPDLRNHTNLFEKYGALILDLIVAKDSEQDFSILETAERHHVSERTVKKIAEEVLGVKIHGNGRQKKQFLDINGWYPNLEKSTNNRVSTDKRTDKNTSRKPTKTEHLREVETLFDREEIDDTTDKRAEFRPTKRFIPTEIKNKESKEKNPPTPLPGSLADNIHERALEFSRAYPQSGWNGSPSRWTEGLLRQVENRMLDKRFDGLMQWDRFMGATRSYAQECSEKQAQWQREGKKGLVLNPVSFIGKDWARDHYRPQKDRDWNTWFEHVAISSPSQDGNAAYLTFLDALRALGATEQGLYSLSNGKARFSCPKTLLVTFEYEIHKKVLDLALSKFPAAIENTAKTLGIAGLKITGAVK